MDSLTPTERSEIMRRVRGKDTKPEIRVRRHLHGLGYRYRLHARELPGTPDIVFRPRKSAIFVHGCFWHRHQGCKLSRMPKSRVEFWNAKLESNRRRDMRHQKELDRMGWRVLIVWECETKNAEALASGLTGFLEQ